MRQAGAEIALVWERWNRVARRSLLDPDDGTAVQDVSCKDRVSPDAEIRDCIAADVAEDDCCFGIVGIGPNDVDLKWLGRRGIGHESRRSGERLPQDRYGYNVTDNVYSDPGRQMTEPLDAEIVERRVDDCDQCYQSDRKLQGIRNVQKLHG